MPAKRAKEIGKITRVIKALTADFLPGLAIDDRGVELEISEDLARVALGVVVEAGERDLRAVWGGLNGFDEPGARAAAHDLAGGGESGVGSLRRR